MQLLCFLHHYKNILNDARYVYLHIKSRFMYTNWRNDSLSHYNKRDSFVYTQLKIMLPSSIKTQKKHSFLSIVFSLIYISISLSLSVGKSWTKEHNSFWIQIECCRNKIHIEYLISHNPNNIAHVFYPHFNSSIRNYLIILL